MNLRQRLGGAWLAVAAALADRATKLAARGAAGGPLIPGIVNLRPVQNRGVAFSLLSGQGLALGLLTGLLLAGLVAWLAARPDASRAFRAGLWLIVGGGLGNLYDRLTAGGVTDFLQLAFVRFAIFNVADICICAGAALALIVAVAEERRGR